MSKMQVAQVHCAAASAARKLYDTDTVYDLLVSLSREARVLTAVILRAFRNRKTFLDSHSLLCIDCNIACTTK